MLLIGLVVKWIITLVFGTKIQGSSPCETAIMFYNLD